MVRRAAGGLLVACRRLLLAIESTEEVGGVSGTADPAARFGAGGVTIDGAGRLLELMVLNTSADEEDVTGTGIFSECL